MATSSSPRPVSLRVGLVLAAVLSLAAVPQAVDVGFSGTGWDVVVVVVAVVTPAVALATVVLLPLAWNGRRGPANGVVLAQLVGALTSLPAYVLVATGEIPAVAAVAAGAGTALTLLVCWLVARGRSAPTAGRVTAPSV